MSKQVKITWRFDNEVITEEVTQLNRREAESAKEQDTVIPIMTGKGISTMANTSLNPADLVMFEDEEGVFALPTEQIIIIQPVEEAS